MTVETSAVGIAVDPSAQAVARFRMRRATFGMIVGLLVQFAAGMLVNLFTKIPDSHPGSNPSEFFSGSLQSVTWAILQSGLPALVFHVVWGLLLMVDGIVLMMVARRVGKRSITVAAVLGFLFVLGAGFNGASVLNYRDDFSSMIMATLFGLAVLMYAVVSTCCRPTPEASDPVRMRSRLVVAPDSRSFGTGLFAPRLPTERSAVSGATSRRLGLARRARATNGCTWA